MLDSAGTGGRRQVEGSTKMTCHDMKEQMPDLLFGLDVADGASQHGAEEKELSAAKAHLAACTDCAQELAELQATMAIMDEWTVAEPNPYFLTRLSARLDEERDAAPVSVWEKIRARFVYGSRMTMRPVAAMAMTVMLLIGGGAYLGLTTWDAPAVQPPAQAAVVHDLQTLDNNAQLLDQLETMSNQNND